MSTVPSFRTRLMLAGACALVASAAPRAIAADASTSPAAVNLGLGQAATATESVTVKAQRRLLKEKNSPSAVTELSQKAIAATGVSGSPATLLRQAPSIYVYQQSIGDNAPELTVRGLRGLEIATTLDGVPTQDLLAPGAFYLSNNIGGIFTLSQISGVSIYPGVAYPDKNTFGTIGGTIAYDTKRPTNDAYIDVTGSAGFFGTFKEGIELNSGAIDSVLGTGDNAVKVLANYANLQTQGYVDGTPNRENEFEFAFDKPYADGLSKFQATVLYNTGNGLIENEPVPVPYLEKYGRFSNYPTNLVFGQEKNDYLTVILKDETYINDYVTAGITGFYLHNDNQLETYGDLGLSLPAGVNGPLTVGGASPFINNPAGFGEGGLYGPATGGLVGNTPIGVFNGGYGGYFYGSGNLYNPYKLYPVGSKGCPANYVNNVWGGLAGGAPCGLNDETTGSSSDTYGLQPKFTITPPDIFGIANTIKVGGLFAKETSPDGYTYLGALPQSTSAANAAGVRTGGTQRTIYQAYLQDKIDLIDNTLHVTPGVTVEGTKSSYKNSNVFGSLQSQYLGPNGIAGPNGYFNGGTALGLDQYGPYKATKWDRDWLPFVSVSYDFDKIVPPLAGLSVYASTGSSALFAPVGDFGPNTAGPPPGASIAHLYEAGVKYDTSKLLISADYFYQKVDRDFGYFSYQSGPQNGQSVYSGFGLRETKGVEATITYQLTPELQLFGNASHLLAKYLSTGNALDTVAQDQYGTVFKGTPETGVPNWLSTFGVDYAKSSFVLDNDALNVRFTGTYTGKQPTTYDLDGNAYLDPNIKYTGLLPLDYSNCPDLAHNGANCAAYTRYNQLTGATTYDPHGGIAAFTVFGADINYKLPTPELPVVKYITFDLNAQNIFNASYWQYYYKQISPGNCGTFSSGPFTGLKKNNYSCSPQFADGIPGQPASVFFTVTARF